MSKKVRLSVNQLAAFTSASSSKKRSIIRQQKNPSPLVVSWYGKAKSVMRNFYKSPEDLFLIEEGLKTLKESKPTSKWQASNRQGSIEILERFITMKVPKCFQSDDVEFVKPALKSVSILGVELITSPDLLFKVKKNGKWKYGAVKFHTSKSGKFNRGQSRIVSTVLKLYLERYLKEFDTTAEVAPEFCLCVDVFNENITSAGLNSKIEEKSITDACTEVIKLWDAA